MPRRPPPPFPRKRKRACNCLVWAPTVHALLLLCVNRHACPLQSVTYMAVSDLSHTRCAACAFSCLQLELNEYADMSWEVFARTRLGFDATKQAARYKEFCLSCRQASAESGRLLCCCAIRC